MQKETDTEKKKIKYDFMRFDDSSKWLDGKWHCRKLVEKM